jgi:hypothetical protein
VNPYPQNPKKPAKPNPADWIGKAQAALDEMRLLSENGVNPASYLTSLIAGNHGFELGGKIKDHLFRQALLNSVAPPRPPPVDLDQDIIIGELFES